MIAKGSQMGMSWQCLRGIFRVARNQHSSAKLQKYILRQLSVAKDGRVVGVPLRNT